MSQALLAQKAGVPQPNLSAIERGEREVSLRTLRALALALDIPAGLLADGVGPDAEKPLVLTRDRLERVAQAVSEGKSLKDPQEDKLARGAALLVKGRLRAAGHAGKGLATGGSTKTGHTWLSLGAAYRREEIQSLVERISEKAAVFNPGPRGKNKGTSKNSLRPSPLEGEGRVRGNKARLLHPHPLLPSREKGMTIFRGSPK